MERKKNPFFFPVVLIYILTDTGIQAEDEISAERERERKEKEIFERIHRVWR